jgi:lycopene cyclase domain-containing protein
MFGNWTYLIWLALFIGLPLLVLMRWRKLFWQRRRALMLITLGSLVGGWAWDALSVRLGIWFYRPDNILGLWLISLPIEEWLWIAGVTLMFSLLSIVILEKSGD